MKKEKQYVDTLLNELEELNNGDTLEVSEFDFIQGSQLKIKHGQPFLNEDCTVLVHPYKIYKLNDKKRLVQLKKNPIVIRVKNVDKNSFVVVKMNIDPNDKQEYSALFEWVAIGAVSPQVIKK